MGTLIDTRIGHFVSDAALYLANHALQSQNVRTIDLFWFQKHTCNVQWARMVRRQFFVCWWVKYIIIFNRLIPGGDAHHLPPTNASRDIHGTLQRSTACFEFTAEEQEMAKAWLRQRGWQEGEPFVCLLVRDSAYLSSHPLHANGKNDCWSYHNYRDSNIDTFADAVQALVDRGYWVIRMSKVAHKRLPLSNSKIIDYPFVAEQDDLLDIWLSAHCAFFISTGSGIDTIPLAYQRPIVFVNFNPLGNFWSYAHNICVPKHLCWKSSGERLTLKEHCQHGYTQSSDYDRAGIVITDLSPSEITAAVLELEDRLSGNWHDAPGDILRQQRFWDAFRAWPEFSKYHGYIHPEARVGSAWLKSEGDSFLS